MTEKDRLIQERERTRGLVWCIYCLATTDPDVKEDHHMLQELIWLMKVIVDDETTDISGHMERLLTKHFPAEVNEWTACKVHPIWSHINTYSEEGETND